MGGREGGREEGRKRERRKERKEGRRTEGGRKVIHIYREYFLIQGLYSVHPRDSQQS